MGVPPVVGTWIWEDNLDVFDSSLVLFLITWFHVWVGRGFGTIIWMYLTHLCCYFLSLGFM